MAILSPERIRILSVMEPGNTYTAQDIMTIWGTARSATTRLLIALAEEGYIKKVSYGKYQLVRLPQDVQTKEPGNPSVYIVRCDKYYKIGRSDNVHQRVSSFQVALPFDVHLIRVLHTDNSSLVEQTLHRRYKTKWVRGEWFLLDIFDVEELLTLTIEQLMDGI